MAVKKQMSLPIEIPSAILPNVVPVGRPGLKYSGGLVDDEFLAELRGAKGVAVYSEMSRNEPVVAGFLLIAEMLLGQTPWEVRSSDPDDPAAVEVAEFVSSCIEDMEGGMSAFMNEFMSALVFGWAWMEKVHKVRRGESFDLPSLKSRHDDGRIGLRRVGLRAQETLHQWEFDEWGDVTAMVQMPPPPDTQVRTIPREKVAHIRIRHTKNNPEGRSLLRAAYTSYYYKKNMQFVEAVGVERYLAGYPVVEVPPELLASQRAEDISTVNNYKDLVQKIKRDQYEGVVIPSEVDREGKPTGYKLRLLNSGGNKPMDVDPIIRRYESRIAMSLLSEFQLLGMDKVGSYSLSSDKTDLFAVALGNILSIRDDAWNTDIIPELVKLNGWSRDLTPTLTHGDIEKADLAQAATSLTALVNAGLIIPDDALEAWTRENWGLPEPDVDSQRATQAPALPMEESL